MITIPSERKIHRLGFHYYPDTFHYSVHDLETWLPELSRIGAAWLTLLAPIERAIPEHFIRGLLTAGVTPVLHFQFANHTRINPQQIRTLFQSYTRWGVNWVCLFDRPNSREKWSPADWAQLDLVERFIDIFLPIAESALEEGLTPIFPPLEPGGDYWDLSFLQSALKSLIRRKRFRLLEKLALGAYAWTGKKPLEWGGGGPESWPAARPYDNPAGSEDQKGFRIFDWYLSILERELGRKAPILLLRAGSLPVDHISQLTGQPDLNAHAEAALAIARLLDTNVPATPARVRIPAEVLACNFWLLTADERSPFAEHAWFRPEKRKLPVVYEFYRWTSRSQLAPTEPFDQTVFQVDEQESNSELSKFDQSAYLQKGFGPNEEAVSQDTTRPNQVPEKQVGGYESLVSFKVAEEQKDPPVMPAKEEIRPEQKQPDAARLQAEVEKPLVQRAPAEGLTHAISHYVLLPLYAWGVGDWDLATIQPILDQEHPTVGFSLTEARLAAKVTVIGGEGAISSEALEMLRANGCEVRRVWDDGTLVAS